MEHSKGHNDLPFDTHACKDHHFHSPHVYGLTGLNFQKFIDTRDVVMVMFYEPSNTKEREIFSRAAETTCRWNHAYAGVNCQEEPQLCQHEGAWRFPEYKLYQKRKIIDTASHITDYNDLSYMVDGEPNTPPPPPPPKPKIPNAKPTRPPY